jgi:hypothetical protein
MDISGSRSGVEYSVVLGGSGGTDIARAVLGVAVVYSGGGAVVLELYGAALGSNGLAGGAGAHGVGVWAMAGVGAGGTSRQWVDVECVYSRYIFESFVLATPLCGSSVVGGGGGGDWGGKYGVAAAWDDDAGTFAGNGDSRARGLAVAAWVSGGGGAEFGICPLESVGGGLVY